MLVTFTEYFKDGTNDYTIAVNNYLNQNSLSTSNLKIILKGGKSMTFKPISCEHTPKLTCSVTGYDATFLAPINKSELKLIQENKLQEFQFNLGGKPYQTRFKKSTEITQKLMKSIACIDLETIYEVKQKKADEMDMTEISKSDYAKTVVGNNLLSINPTEPCQSNPNQIKAINQSINPSNHSLTHSLSPTTPSIHPLDQIRIVSYLNRI